MSTPGPAAPDAQPDATPSRPGRDVTAGGVRTSPRSKGRRKAAPLAKIGMILFAFGLLAVAVDFVLFASGSHDLPLWLNLTAMLAPVGLGLGLIGVVLENRASSPALAARKAAAGQ